MVYPFLKLVRRPLVVTPPKDAQSTACDEKSTADRHANDKEISEYSLVDDYIERIKTKQHVTCDHKSEQMHSQSANHSCQRTEAVLCTNLLQQQNKNFTGDKN